MARDGQLPRVLSKVSSHQVPKNALLLIAGLSLVIGILGTSQQELLTTLVTFGALTAYIMLNVAVIVQFGVRQKSKNFFLHWVSPVLGSAVLIYALIHTSTLTKVLGISWLVIGSFLAVYWSRKPGRIDGLTQRPSAHDR